jgi:glutathione peroxidase-family protein
MDGSTWTELDRHTNDQTANSNHQIGTFCISNDFECQFVRFRQTGVNAGGNHSLILYAMEIFGDLIE